MPPAATRPHAASTLYLAFELGNTEWKLAMSTRVDQAPLVRAMPARALKILEAELTRARTHFGLSATAPVQSCYEAGRDGFWLHRYLASRGIANSIVDSSSIEVNRRRRRTKTDRLDASKLVTMLLRADAGERKVWSVVNVPAPAEEDRRQVHRELLFARRDRGRHTNRIKGLLASQGLPLRRIQELPTHLARARLWDGSPLPPLLYARLEREWETVIDYTTRIRSLKKERRQLLRTVDDPAIAQVRQLNQLRGIGIDSAWLYVMEFFAWRQFRNQHRMGVAQISTEERSRPLVREEIRGWEWSGAENRNRCSGAKALDRLLALSRDRNCSGRRRAPHITPARAMARTATDWRERPAIGRRVYRHRLCTVR